MVRRSSLFVTALIGLLALACGSSTPGGGAAKAAASSATAALPGDVAAVIGINIQSLLASKPYKKFEKSIMTDEVKKKIADANKCGMDVMKDFQSIIIAGDKIGLIRKKDDDGGEPDRTIIVVKARWDQAKAEKCLTEWMKLDTEPKTLTVSKDGKVVKYDDGEKPMYGVWIAGDTVALTSTPERAKEIAEPKTRLKDNKLLSELMGKVDTSASFWAVADTSKTGGAMGELGAEPTAMWGNLTIAQGLEASGGARFASADDAKKVNEQAKAGLEQAKQQAGMFKSMLDGIKLSQSGTDVKVSAKLSGDQLDTILSMASSFVEDAVKGMSGGSAE